MLVTPARLGWQIQWMGKWIYILATGYTGFDEGSELPEPEAEELMEEDAPGPAKRTKRTYSREQLDVLERECFRGTMKNADIAAAITRLNGAREVTTQDVRSWRANAKKRRKAAV